MCPYSVKFLSMQQLSLKKLFSFASLLLVSQGLAHADDFHCIAQNTGLHIDILNQLDSNTEDKGVPPVMWVSNPALAEDHQTLVTFTQDKLTHPAKGVYQAKVDLRAIGSFHKDAIIAGAKLQELKRIDLQFNFDETGKEVPGKAAYLKRTGEVIDEPVTCTRSLKHI